MHRQSLINFNSNEFNLPTNKAPFPLRKTKKDDYIQPVPVYTSLNYPSLVFHKNKV